jgi:hypothetical protein
MSLNGTLAKVQSRRDHQPVRIAARSVDVSDVTVIGLGAKGATYIELMSAGMVCSRVRARPASATRNFRCDQSPSVIDS